MLLCAAFLCSLQSAVPSRIALMIDRFEWALVVRPTVVCESV
jgi:hypothetical protein